MTPEAALYSFLTDAGYPVYAQSSVPDGAEFPYVTYTLTVGDWESGEVNIPVSMWFRTSSEAVPNSAVRRLGEMVPMGGVTIPCDGGMLWVKRGSPWAQAVMVTEDEAGVKRRYVNLDVEYIIT